jgi:excisionase family DNA binding protein
MPKNDQISVREAAAILRVRLDSVYALVWTGQLRAKKVDGLWWIDRAAVDRRRESLRRNRTWVAKRHAAKRMKALTVDSMGATP